jgi:hypothetical protein
MEGLKTFQLPERDWFTELAAGVRFESVASGREGAIVVKVEEEGVPLVRSTTPYAGPHQVFCPAHTELLAAIGATVEYNNLMVERYDCTYRSMGAHTDMAIDLADNSLISLVSCYNNPATTDVRSLVCTEKDTGAVVSVLLEHNSIVTFSTALNRRMKHKIVAGGEPDPSTVWLGVTLRTSKRAVTFSKDGVAWLRPGIPLVLANYYQRATLFKLRGEENKASDFSYCDYEDYATTTISPSDLLPPF